MTAILHVVKVHSYIEDVYPYYYIIELWGLSGLLST